MRYLAIIGLILYVLSCGAQSSVAKDSIYSNDLDFKLKDGVYLLWEDFILNKPSLKFEQLTTKEGKQISEFRPLERIYFVKTGDSTLKLNPAEIFGFTENGTFYIQFEHEGSSYFGRTVNPGALWQFAAMVISYQRTLSYNPYFPGDYRTIPSKDLKQIILNYKTGEVYPANSKVLIPILAKDPKIASLLDKTPKRKRKKRLFYFLRKYNENNPVAFPK
ncbi:hypothetical protein [Luteibaculum oceani]|uniref:DUF4384 domain-containing protein n=1 Tax=Luteibaculum oceani TaxID=1294296 RepID=A0A5C6V2P0_9FLAO|nr:hypothetical protein [Luteibaculum oceani]TXC78911.1 hypothetical protein FRX97_06770 [Luteibaculum oceani]